MALSRPARDQRDRLRSEPGHCALAHSTTAPSGFAGWGRRGFDRREATASQTTARAPPQTKHPSQGVCFTPKSVFVKRNSTENRHELLLCTKHAFVPIRPRVGGSPYVVHRKSQSGMTEGIEQNYIDSDDRGVVRTNRTRLTPRGTPNQKIGSMIRRSKSAELPRDSHDGSTRDGVGTRSCPTEHAYAPGPSSRRRGSSGSRRVRGPMLRLGALGDDRCG